MRKALTLIAVFVSFQGITQNIGIGTTSPNPKAILDVQASNKGVLFPRLSTVQRDAIVDPPDGLHIFNTDERCLNFFDSLYQVWNCYCDMDSCKWQVVTLPSGCSINFFSAYASKYPAAKKFAIKINEGDTIHGCNGPALNFSLTTANTTIKIVNRGVIIGYGGQGGIGASGQAGSCPVSHWPGAAGGDAIATKSGVVVMVDNYGLIAGGGGGGGGGGGATSASGVYGGGGGGGAGFNHSLGGKGGGTTVQTQGGICTPQTRVASNGEGGSTITYGNGGQGANGGGSGGKGGALGQAGLAGDGVFAGPGGAAGKAIGGGNSNQIRNFLGGQSYGIVD